MREEERFGSGPDRPPVVRYPVGLRVEARPEEEIPVYDPGAIIW